ncbi:histidinol-phosphate aminotransferase [Xenorhabdus mauleonii]|uniref:Histidinol-phosphatase n=1 Tax=Xenorhabdus mauleonii TaxID=351675 RepID=A0A1I3IG71_9GAMM|nr:inositol monophosphatase family protein [Xenorhabdus mauleonii]PHM39492.1 histidinol-phosphate aminotransferase [Xenorhabdus mauleonii]SFI47035.1 histidinol-phosphatase [Xenorhabdus mauleonii]
MLEIALEAVNSIRKKTQDAFNEAEKFDYKPDRSIVTQTDLMLETEIRNIFAKRSPGVSVWGEEYGLNGAEKFDSGWVIDPIDGTRAFLYGIPLFSTLIAFVEQGEPVVGVMSFPAISTTFYAAKGKGCWKSVEGKPQQQLKIAKNSPETVEQAVITASGIHSTNYNLADGTIAYDLDSVVKTARDFTFVNDAYQHAMVAAGRLHCAIDTLMKPWDSAAILPCIREAGGDFCSLDGSREKVMFGGSLISASTPALLDSVVEIMKPSTSD